MGTPEHRTPDRAERRSPFSCGQRAMRDGPQQHHDGGRSLVGAMRDTPRSRVELAGAERSLAVVAHEVRASRSPPPRALLERQLPSAIIITGATLVRSPRSERQVECRFARFARFAARRELLAERTALSGPRARLLLRRSRSRGRYYDRCCCCCWPPGAPPVRCSRIRVMYERARWMCAGTETCGTRCR